MKTSLALLALAGTANGLLTADYVENNHHALFAQFKKTHQKAYATPSEEAARKQVFKVNMLKAAELQAKAPSATYGMNKFADMTEDEFHPYAHGMVHMPHEKAIPELFDVPEKVKSVDWRSKGAVTAVKDQGQCGSCWTFSTTGVTESANFLHGDGKLTSLSEQLFVSCDDTCYGCNGGLPVYAYDWLVKNHDGKAVTEEAYPYTSYYGQVDSCSWSSSMATGATITGQASIAQDEAQMAAWMAKNGPISIGVNAMPWQSYTGGVMTVAECPVEQPDHAVLAVGVTADYWIVKNSWASSWGENGYIRLAYGTNTCNIVFQPSAPTF